MYKKGILYLHDLTKEQKEVMGEECIRVIKEKSSVGGWKRQLLGIG